MVDPTVRAVVSMLLLALTLTRLQAAEAEIRLASPLTRVLEAAVPLPRDATAIVAEVLVEDDAPTDLGLGIYVRGDDGRWFQHAKEGAIRPGRRTLRVPLDDAAAWRSEPVGESWTPYRRALGERYGLVAWSASGSRARLRVASLGIERGAPAPAPTAWALRDLALDGVDAAGVAHAQAGERWQLSLRPSPFPAEAYDPDEFALDLQVTAPSGECAVLPGFYDQPMRLSDRGDREAAISSAPALFRARFRPREPGPHHLRLIARWRGGHALAVDLPDLAVAGEARDDILRADANDPRFFSAGGRFCWPVGLNLASPHDGGVPGNTDPRYGVGPTPNRGSRSYEAYFARLGAAGGDAAEIWLSSWNLALEWSRTWPGYHGIGRYNEAHAAMLDRVLDSAWSHGLRLVLNLNNHGQFLPGSGESEWQWNPYNAALGGPLHDAEEVFTSPAAIAAQARLRRYLVGRYADHPGVLCWKLWSEVDLTKLGIRAIRSYGGGMDQLAGWHAAAADAWHALDAYHHPVATHFATTYQNAHPAIVGLPGLDAVLLDCYFQPGVYTSADRFFGLMVDTMLERGRGLARLRKPVFATEYGGGWTEQSIDRLAAEHRSGAFLALVTGEAAAPMLWWHEWVDQREQWLPYGAIHRFIAGEDLRGEGSSVTLAAGAPDAELRAQAWRRPGRLLAYIEDRAWDRSFADPPLRVGAWVEIGMRAEPGTVHYEWWDADLGTVIDSGSVIHAGGPLRLVAPSFYAHLALKAWR